jgi:hypothetical protein
MEKKKDNMNIKSEESQNKLEYLIESKMDSNLPRKSSTNSDDETKKRKKPSGSSHSEDNDFDLTPKKYCVYKIFEKLRELEITFKAADKKFDDSNYCIKIVIQKYADFVNEINEAKNGINPKFLSLFVEYN